MRKLVYECKKDNATIKTTSMVEALNLQMGGWNITEVLETIPEKVSADPKQMARRVVI